MAIDERSRAVLEGLVGRIDVDEYVARLQRAVESMPEYQGFVDGQVDLDDRGPAGIRWNLEIFLRWATDAGPPTPAELEQLRAMIAARAAEGRPPEEGLAVYRRAMRAGWEAVLESANERERAALGGAFEVLLEWLDIVSAVFEQAYAEERETLVSQQERRARRLLERIVAGEEPAADDERLADALGFDLAAPHRPLAATLAGGNAAQHLQLAALLRDRGALAISEGKRLVGLVNAPVDEQALGFADKLVICVEEQPAQAADLAEALEDLRRVVALAELAGDRGRIGPETRLPELLLARSPRIARRLHDRTFGPLRASQRADLEQTLASLAAHGFERSATAAALDIHRNTLAQRIARIEGLTGLDLDAADDRGLVWLAARCAQCTPE